MAQLRDIVTPWINNSDKSQHNTARNDSNRRQNTRHETNHANSSNLDFSKQVNRLDKAIRLQHAKQHWNPIPDSIDQLLNRCANNIKPPGYDETYATELSKIFQTLKDKMHTLTRCHLEKHFQAKLAEFEDGDLRDLETIKSVATKSAKRRTRINNNTIEAVFEQLRDISPAPAAQAAENKGPTRGQGSPRGPTSKNRQTANIPQKGRTYAAVAANRHTDDDEDSTVEPDGDLLFQVPRNVAKIQHTSQVGPPSLNNRFDALAGNDIDDQLTESQLLRLIDDSMDETSMVPPTLCPTPAKRKRKDSPETETMRTKTFVTQAHAQNGVTHPSATLGAITTTPTLEEAQTCMEDDVIITGHTPANQAPPGVNQTSKKAMDDTVHDKGAERLRSMSATTAPTNESKEVICYSSKEKEQWIIKDIPVYKKVVIIADSNAQGWLNCSALWSVHSFSGNTLEHTLQILEKSKFPPHIKIAVIAVGVNNRETLPSAVMDTLHEIKQTFEKKHGIQSRFLMIPQLPTFNGGQSARIRNLNRTARDMWGHCFIPCPTGKQVQARNADDDAHYSLGTAAKICDRLHKNLPEVF